MEVCPFRIQLFREINSGLFPLSNINVGDREPILNISHESNSVGNSEAAIWQWMCLIG